MKSSKQSNKAGGSRDSKPRHNPYVLEPDRRLLIAALAIGVIVGALLAHDKSSSSSRAAAAATPIAQPHK